ncbi:MAG TPA: hypothetical protein V6D06_14560 [Trichocoleus sp.]
MPRIPGVPDTGEYAQLHDLADIAYWEDKERILPLQKAMRGHVFDDNFAAYSHLRLWVQALMEEAQQARWRREEMIHWLYLDTQLRAEGKTYPDVYEALPAKTPNPDDEF